MQSRELSRQKQQYKNQVSIRDSSMDSQLYGPNSKENTKRDMCINDNSVQREERAQENLTSSAMQDYYQREQNVEESSFDQKKNSHDLEQSCDTCHKPSVQSRKNNFSFNKESVFQHSQTHHSRDSEGHEDESKQSIRGGGKKYNFPKEATCILKKWLIDHVEHPYLKNNDKIFLSKETGLTRKQVQNWFTNVRKRIWQPLMSKFKNKKDLKKIILKLKLRLDSSSSDEGDSQDGMSSSRGDSSEPKESVKIQNASSHNESLMLQVGMKRLNRQFDQQNGYDQFDSHIKQDKIEEEKKTTNQEYLINAKRAIQRKSVEHSEDTKVKQYLQQMDQFNKKHQQQMRETDHVSSNIGSGDNKSGGSNDSNIAYFESSTNGMRNQNQTANIVNGSSGSGNSNTNGNQTPNIPVVVMCCPNLVKGEPCFCGHQNIVQLPSNVQLHQFLNSMMGMQTSSTGSSSNQQNNNRHGGSSGPFSAQHQQQGEFYYLVDDPNDIALPHQPSMSWMTGSQSFQTIPTMGLPENLVPNNLAGLGGQPTATSPENLLTNNNPQMMNTNGLQEVQLMEKYEEVANHIKSLFTILGQNPTQNPSSTNIPFNQMFYLMMLQQLLAQLFHQLLFFQTSSTTNSSNSLTKTHVQEMGNQPNTQSYPNYFQQQSNVSGANSMPQYHHQPYSSSSSSGGSNLLTMRDDKKKQSYESIYFPNVHLPRPPCSNLGSSSNQSNISK